MLNLKSRLKNAIHSAVEITSSTLKDDVWGVYQNKKEQHMNQVRKERTNTYAKSILAAIYIALNTDTRDISIKTGLMGMKVLYSNDNPLKSILKLAVNTNDLMSARALNDIDSPVHREIIQNVINMVSNITGYTVDEILNLKFNHNAIDAPTGTEVIFKNEVDPNNFEDDLEDRQLKEASLIGYDKECDAYKELIIPTLNERLALACANWVQGIAPNKFELVIKDLNTITAELVPAFVDYKNKIWDIKSDIELPSLYNEDGTVKLNR